MIKKLIAGLVVIALVLSGCATKRDAEMYEDYTLAISSSAKHQATAFNTQVQILVESLKVATTPLERHMIRESLSKLGVSVQHIERARNGNDVASDVVGVVPEIVTGTVIGLGIMEASNVLQGMAQKSGQVTATEGSTINQTFNEEHTSAVGNDTVATSKADPIVVEVPVEAEVEVKEE